MKPILERLVSEDDVVIGDDAPTLLAFKIFAGLPADTRWTEADGLLKSLLAAAEARVVSLTGCSYQVRSYSYQLDGFCRSGGFYSLRLPVYPVLVSEESPTTINWVDNNEDSGTFEEDEDYKIYGRTTLTPEIIFLDKQLVLPSTNLVPYPYTVNLVAGPCQEQDVARTTIFELATFYYRFPEAMTDKNPNVGPMFNANIDMLANNQL